MEDNFINSKNLPERTVHVSGMYKNWFLDYASYVILERAVPHINDGLKPVQRRILHSLKEMHDGRYHKVANVIGNTMKYHPHGDASIGDAMVQIGQKDLLLDMQGNWGNIATGDSAAAPRYIEVRLTQFALDVVYNKKITKWNSSYDGRGKEPTTFPVKFPLLLNQGVEGIAVGLSTRILSHNFNELIDASIKILKGVKPKIYPDFLTGGTADFTNYNDGKRGGKVRIRAKIDIDSKDKLVITELPFSTNTTSLINSIIKANEKGKIKIKKIEDNTAENVEIVITIPSGISADKTIDALYSFTNCEISLSPICCIIENNVPIFIGVSELLQKSTNHSLGLMKQELEINLDELQERWHFASLERIFIENRIYHSIEELESWDVIIKTIHNQLAPFTKKLLRKVTDSDVEKLTEIRIKKITKYDLNKVKKEIDNLENNIQETKNNLENLIDYAINYFKELKVKYGKGKERKTEIKIFENIDAKKVVVASKKLYVNREEGFIGTTMRKDEYVCECSDIDDIIVFRSNGSMQVVKVDNKVFVGKDIIHCAVFKKKDDRTIYNMIYKDAKSGNTMIKRFPVKSITRNKEYILTKNQNSCKVIYFTSNPNGEAECVTVHLRKLNRIKNLKIEIDFADYIIKGKGAIGNILTKYPVRKVELKSIGVSTLSARKIWFDENINRLNVEQRGTFIGEFKAEEKILTIKDSGEIELKSFELSNHFSDDILIIEKFNPNKALSAIYFDGNKEEFFVKRFLVPENISQKLQIITSHKNSYLELISSDWKPQIEIIYVKKKGKERESEIIDLEKFISVKGIKAKGNKLTSKKIKEINLLEPLEYNENDDNNKSLDDGIKENLNDIELKITNSISDNDHKGQITLEL